jgi:hypothetical protein
LEKKEKRLKARETDQLPVLPIMNVLEIIFVVFGVCGLGFWLLSVFTSLGRGPEKFALIEPVTFSDRSFFTALEGVSRATFEQGGLPTTLDNGDVQTINRDRTAY